jgi:PEP-CTERM motif
MSGNIRKIALSTLSGVALLVTLASAADASVVTIGFSVGGGAIAVLATGTDSATITAPVPTGTNSISAFAAPALPTDLLDSTSLNITTAGPLTFSVFITAQGLTSPLGLNTFTSNFTSNTLPAGWSVTEATFISAANGLFTGTPLSSATFNAIGTSVKTATFNSVAPFSVTEVYTVNATNAGTVLSTISLSAAVPEPSTWAMMILGFIGVGFMAYRRKDKQAGFRFA